MIPTNNEPSISVIVPNYNGGRFLRACLDSLLAQTFPHVEIIIRDGNSTDDSLSIIRDYAARCPGLQYVSEPDHGQADALNKGFASAKGHYLTWLNSDDRLAPSALETAFRALEANPGVVLVYGSVIDMHENGTFLSLNAGKPLPKEELVFSDFIPQAGALFRKTTGVKADESLHWAFDWELWIQLSKHGDIQCLNHLMGYCIIAGHYERKSNRLTARRTAELLRITRRHMTGFEARLLFVYVALVLGYALTPLRVVWPGYYRWIMKAVGKLSELLLPRGKGIML